MADKCGSHSELHENTAGGRGGARKIKVNHIYENGALKVIGFKQAVCVSGWPGFLSILNFSSVFELNSFLSVFSPLKNTDGYNQALPDFHACIASCHLGAIRAVLVAAKTQT